MKTEARVAWTSREGAVGRVGGGAGGEILVCCDLFLLTFRIRQRSAAATNQLVSRTVNREAAKIFSHRQECQLITRQSDIPFRRCVIFRRWKPPFPEFSSNDWH